MPQLDRAIVKSRAARLREAASAALVRFLDDQIGKRAGAVIETGGRIRLPNFAVGKLSAPAGAPGAVIRVEILARRGDELVAAPVHAKEAA
jgi:threonylcarbamoyladenosine tRNA methylthiotransferase MtaB